jgi:hypothetical protein
MRYHIYVHARHIETYLSTYFSPNTHLTGEALGLYYIGSMLPDISESGRWRDKGRRILLEELRRQVRSDGVYFEQSTYYHRYTVDFYLHFLVLSEALGEPVRPKVQEKLRALLNFMLYVMRPDGTTPFVGDDDGGQLVCLDSRPFNDFRSTLASGAGLLDCGEYKFAAGAVAAPEATFWLLGPKGAKRYDALAGQRPTRTSSSFSEGGFYAMRDSWASDANYMLLDCGPIGSLNGGHGHADTLSFELVAGGKAVIVDSGTYTYAASLELRNFFRGSLAHNAPLIDLQPSSVPGSAFAWQRAARSRVNSWMSFKRLDFFEGSHEGYANLMSPASISRSVLFLKKDYWVIRDRIEAEGQHTHQTLFHFAATVECRVLSSNTSQVSAKVSSFGCDDVVHSGRPVLEMFSSKRDGCWRVERGLISGVYGERSSADVCVREGEGTGVQDLFVIAAPGPGLSVKEASAQGGRAFEIHQRDRRDILLLSQKSGGVQSCGFESDCSWVWARSRHGEEVPEEVLVIGGTRLSFRGVPFWHLIEPHSSTPPQACWTAVWRERAVEIEVSPGMAFEFRTFGMERAIINGKLFTLDPGDRARFPADFSRNHP